MAQTTPPFKALATVTPATTFPPYAASAVARDDGGAVAPARVPERHTVSRPDDELVTAAGRALREEPGVPPDTISLRVHQGQLTLDGCVETFYQRACAERAVRFVDGVSTVVNRIEVKPPVSASDVRLRLMAELRETVRAEAQGIEVQACAGVVTLRGAVHSEVERRAAELAALAVRGVQRVDNQLQVAG